MKETCGLFIYSLTNNGILICHPTNCDDKSWSIPKGIKDFDSESYIDAAKRETREETGLDITKIELFGIYPLSPVEYKHGKKILRSFLIITSENLKRVNYKCVSWVDLKTPEMDDWKVVSTKDITKYCHYTQSSLVNEIEKILKEKVLV